MTFRRKLPSKTPPLEQTTATTEQIAAIKELQDLGRIDIEFEEMRSAAKEFSLHAASILAKGALEEFSTHLRKCKFFSPSMLVVLDVAGNATREHFDRNPQKNRYRDVVCGDCKSERLQCFRILPCFQMSVLFSIISRLMVTIFTQIMSEDRRYPLISILYLHR